MWLVEEHNTDVFFVRPGVYTQLFIEHYLEQITGVPQAMKNVDAQIHWNLREHNSRRNASRFFVNLSAFELIL